MNSHLRGTQQSSQPRGAQNHPPGGCTEDLGCTETCSRAQCWWHGAGNVASGVLHAPSSAAAWHGTARHSTARHGCRRRQPRLGPWVTGNTTDPAPSPSLLFLPYKKHTGWFLQMRKNYSSYRAHDFCLPPASLAPPRHSLQRVLIIFYLANVSYYYHYHYYYYFLDLCKTLFTFTLAYSTPAPRGASLLSEPGDFPYCTPVLCALYNDARNTK